MKLYFEANSKKMRDKHIDPYTMEWVDVYKYKGFEIDDTANGFCLFYCGDDIYFPTLEEAEEFIDGELNESLLKEDSGEKKLYCFSRMNNGKKGYLGKNGELTPKKDFALKYSEDYIKFLKKHYEMNDGWEIEEV